MKLTKKQIRKSFVRTRTITAGDYKEVSLFVRTSEQERKNKESGRKKKKVSRPVQKNLNDRNSKRYAKLLIYANFFPYDYYMHYSYKDKFLPETPRDAKRQVRNYLEKLRRLYASQGFELKYMWFTSYVFDDDLGYITRIHHHAIISRGPSRDDVEECWSVGGGKNKEKIGKTEADLIQPTSDGINDMAAYLTSQEKWESYRAKEGEKKWSSSQNLEKPYQTKNDYEFSQRHLEEMGKDNSIAIEELKKKYPDYQVIGKVVSFYNEKSGWYLQVELLKWDYQKRKRGAP